MAAYWSWSIRSRGASIVFDDGGSLPVAEFTATISAYDGSTMEWISIVEGDHLQVTLYDRAGRTAVVRCPEGYEYEGIFTGFQFTPIGGERQLSWEIRGTLALRTIRNTNAAGGAPINVGLTLEWPQVDFTPIFDDGPSSTTADRRAEELLLTCLDEGQKADYRENRTFVVRAPSGRRYRVRPARSFNVDELDKKDRPRLRLCAVPSSSVPMADQMLAQKLWLEADEKAFRRKANKSRF